jgi:DNA-binding Lrp family transcriptional regulator
VKEHLDRIDRHILALLQENARLSNKELAARVGLAPSTCLERVRRLQANSHLIGFHAEVAPASLGIQLQAMVFVQLERHTAELMSRFRERITPLPEVLATYHVAGQHDFLVHVAARSADDLQRIILELSRAEIRHIQTALIFDHHRTQKLPDLTG